jgi:DNA-binding MarR family transcriptional regulator
MAEHPDPLLQELIRLVGVLALRMRAHLDAVAKEFDLTVIEARALIVLGAPRSMSELADGLVCDASYSTLIADHLEARGLVRRQVDPHDRRIKRLAITPKGRRIRERMQVRAEQGLPAVAGLTMAQRRALRDLLARAAEAATDQPLEGEICREAGR